MSTSSFKDKHLIEANLYWDATFHSYNQRTGDFYYVITTYLKEKDHFTPQARFGAVISEYDFGMNPSALKEQEMTVKLLAPIAAEGKTNIPENILWKGIGQDGVDRL